MKRLLPLLLLLPAPAMAHGLHEQGTLMSGALHPVSGLDHVLAMLAVGLLAAQLSGRSLWALPATFVGAMLLGGLFGANGLPFPAVEPMILASIVILGVLVALATRLPLPALLAMTAAFGAAHGWAHGAEGPASGLAAYTAGFVLVTSVLHVAGIALGRGLPALALRVFGTGTVAAGLTLALVSS